MPVSGVSPVVPPSPPEPGLMSSETEPVGPSTDEPLGAPGQVDPILDLSDLAVTEEVTGASSSEADLDTRPDAGNEAGQRSHSKKIGT